MKTVAITLVLLLLCACVSSPPVRFYVLDSIAPASDAPKPGGAPLQIAAVHLPATLDRRQMVREDPPNHLSISDENRWGAPLSDMTRHILSQNLRARLAPGRLVLSEQPAPAGTSAISVDILQFGRAGDSIVLDGAWSIVPSGAEEAAATHHFLLTRPVVQGDYADQAHVMSILLGQLADSIAQAPSEP